MSKLLISLINQECMLKSEDGIWFNGNADLKCKILEVDKVIRSVYFILNLCAKFSLKSQPSIYGKYGKWIL